MILKNLKIFSKLKSNLPLLLVVIIALVIAITNIDVNKIYSGWDNIHAEFDLGRYAKQVFFGAWLEHQSLSAPAAQGHLSEITRLPILLFLKITLPDNLVRYIFIFSYYLIGGIGMYLYLSKIWLKGKLKELKNWLASLGGIFYLLHILTLQQFYISFEMFMVQFAWFPFLLIIIHHLAKKITAKNLLLFFLVQLLLAPSAHTPTVYYLGVILSLLYGFFLKIHAGKIKALIFAFLIGFYTFISNAYWIAPNLYYSFFHSNYVQGSRDNQLFGPESVASIKEASTLPNFLKSTQYLFSWQDYSFANQKFDNIFQEWKPHLNNLGVKFLLSLFGIITFLGLFSLIFDKNDSSKRWSIIIFYFFCLALIWIDLFPTKYLINFLYHSGSFMEAFRNPFTKLSILYSILSVLLFTHAVQFLLIKILLITKWKNNIFLTRIIILILMVAIICSAWPSFQGHFLSEKLQVIYPKQYQEMFEFLKGQNQNLRVLQLPQLSHAGWEYYDWQFIKPGNGYQGMGFYFFGIPQATLNRDSDRWVETSDFFYHELKYAIDTQNSQNFQAVLEKYRIDLVVIDETKVEPNRDHDYQLDHQLVTKAGLKKIWSKDFLSVYQKSALDQNDKLFTPQNIDFVQANTDRVRADYVYQKEQNYISSSNAGLIYPFSHLVAKTIDSLNFNNDTVTIEQKVSPDKYSLTLPGLKTSTYFTPAQIEYQGNKITIKFPTTTLQFSDQIISLPKLSDMELAVDEKVTSDVILFFNNLGVVINKNQTAYPILAFDTRQPINIGYSLKPDKISLDEDGSLQNQNIQTTLIKKIDPDWTEFKKDQKVLTPLIDKLIVTSHFPVIELNLLQNPSENCSTNSKGSILTQNNNADVIYEADKYGVNCNGYTFDYLSPSYSYLLNIIGENVQGRSIKFFINFENYELLPEDYLMDEGKFNTVITLDKITTDPRSRIYLNWETRSFGQKSINQLNKMQLVAFPLDQISQTRLETQNNQPKISNQLNIKSINKYFESIYLTNLTCQSSSCFLALDDTYDPLWIGISLNHFQILSHFRLNNWANTWEISQSGKYIIFYLPELISQFLFYSFLVTLIITAFLSNKNKIKQKQKINFVKRQLLGEHKKPKVS